MWDCTHRTFEYPGRKMSVPPNQAEPFQCVDAGFILANGWGSRFKRLRDCYIGSPKYPHGQGFIAPTSMKFAGKEYEPRARLMVTSRSSIG